jgi:hypothetical protein
MERGKVSAELLGIPQKAINYLTFINIREILAFG